jgi:hypothetical protein
VCRGYLKTHTRLQATPAAELALEDLASAGLDAAALGHGYARPQGLGFPLGVRIVERPKAAGPGPMVDNARSLMQLVRPPGRAA